MPNPFLSIIIPAFNEEQRLPLTLEQVQAFLDAQTYSAEIVVVENGSSDRTLELAQAFAANHPNVRVFHSAERGKGRAVRMGMLEAKGDFRFICDADLSMPVAEISRFIPPVLDADVVIASREAPGAVRYDEPSARHWTGRLFNLMVRWFFLPGLQDTQCGFKCFRGSVAAEIFPLQITTGWTFDVEVLYLARRRGYRIVELPVPWYYNDESKVRVMRDLRQVVRELWTIFWNARVGKYK